jgi:DNA-binding NarL/FixJ family response regulator
MMSEKVRVLLVDDHEMFREGLRELLSHRPDIEVVGEAGTGHGALEGMSANPDVVVLDIRLPDMDGVSVCSQIIENHPDTRVVMLTMYGDDEYLFQAIKAGAVGYVLKDASSEEVVAAIRAAAEGRVNLDASSMAKLVNEYKRLAQVKAGNDRRVLSERDLVMLALIADGATNRMIATHLSLSEQTVKNALSVLYQKLGVRNRAEAVVAIMQEGIRLPKLGGDE